jgi:hypothetical protein
MRRAVFCSVPLTSLVALVSSLRVVPPQTHSTVDDVRSIIEREFQGAFVLGGSAPGKEITPSFVTGDFNGDGRGDLAALITVKPDVLQQRLARDPRSPLSGLIVSKVVGKGMPAQAIKEAELTLADLAEHFQRSIVLLILHSFDQPASSAARFALLDFCNNGNMAMSVFRGTLSAAAAGDIPIISPPRLKGDALRFLDDNGEGTTVYWDGLRYRWYPVTPVTQRGAERVQTPGEIAPVARTAGDGQARQPCKANPKLVGACFSVYGRMRAYNGNPTFRIWPVGTRRLLGVTGADPGENPIMPGDLGVSFDRDIYADFEVCPFPKQAVGVMQRVCIEIARNQGR